MEANGKSDRVAITKRCDDNDIVVVVTSSKQSLFSLVGLQTILDDRSKFF